MQKTIHFSLLIRDRDYQDSRKIDNKCYLGIYSYIAVDNNKWLALIRSLLVAENLGIWKFALKFNFQLVACFFFSFLLDNELAREFFVSNCNYKLCQSYDSEYSCCNYCGCYLICTNVHAALQESTVDNTST